MSAKHITPRLRHAALIFTGIAAAVLAGPAVARPLPLSKETGRLNRPVEVTLKAAYHADPAAWICLPVDRLAQVGEARAPLGTAPAMTCHQREGWKARGVSIVTR